MTASNSASKNVTIGPFVFDTERRLLVERGGSVALSLMEFQLLSLLVAKKPRAVAKDDIQQTLWPRTVVAETSLTTLVRELRMKLRQEGRGRPIRTVHGFGYALEDPPGAPTTAPRLLRGRSEMRVTPPEMILGREPGRPGSIDDASVSRRHARLRWENTDVILTDLASKNGTYVRGVRVSEPVILNDGDEIRLGLVTFVYRGPASGVASDTKTAV